MPPDTQENQQQDPQSLESRFMALKQIIDSVRLPTSWNFTLPAIFRKITATQIILPPIAKADAKDQFVMSAGSGAPTGTPTLKGAMYFDYTNNKLYAWNGSAWKAATFS